MRNEREHYKLLMTDQVDVNVQQKGQCVTLYFPNIPYTHLATELFTSFIHSSKRALSYHLQNVIQVHAEECLRT